MKKSIIRIIVAAILLLASASTLLADGGLPQPPFCCPGCTCN